MRRILIALVRFYQYTLSPWKGATCRFHPSCSEYFIEAVNTHGAVRGALLGLWRILRCTPLSRGGYDPVPPKRKKGEKENPDPGGTARGVQEK